MNSLDQHVRALETEYDTLNEEFAKGENTKFDEMFSPETFNPHDLHS